MANCIDYILTGPSGGAANGGGVGGRVLQFNPFDCDGWQPWCAGAEDRKVTPVCKTALAICPSHGGKKSKKQRKSKRHYKSKKRGKKHTKRRNRKVKRTGKRK